MDLRLWNKSFTFWELSCKKSIRYVGVWQEESGVLKSFWNRSVAQVGFTGTAIRVLGNSAGPVAIYVDGCQTWNAPIKDSVDISVEEGSHVLKIGRIRGDGVVSFAIKTQLRPLSVSL